MRRPQFLNSQKHQEQQWRANREGVHPDIIEFDKGLVKAMGKLGVPMFAAEMYRTPQRQDDMFALGLSRAKAGKGAHPYGCALDIVHSTEGWNIPKEAWLLIGHVGKELIQKKGLALVSLAWGGDWGFYDPAHWEIDGWQMLKDRYPWPPKK